LLKACRTVESSVKAFPSGSGPSALEPWHSDSVTVEYRDDFGFALSKNSVRIGRQPID
jgi:hypothetical protein